MVEIGDAAPQFTAPMATPEAAAGKRGSYTSGDVEAFSLAEALDDGPVVLAFFPGVFSRTCTEELCEVRDWRDALTGLDAQVYGVSVDPPFPQLAFVDEYDLSYPLLSAFNNDVAADYGVRREAGILRGVTERSVFVVDPSGTVVYDWVVTEPQVFPDLDAVESALADAA
ncbi:redoxin domain-containing protein [Halomarina litorea]|uniref:redoxin domain-containing protein n=1 Tax=Halomarina litorea TaxID=2961595 RepID=UPI0020C542C4|nr:redoxin domain-containing protein [Halomarina sp. BCD28]